MRVTREQAAANREKILEVAGRLFRDPRLSGEILEAVAESVAR